MADPIKLCDRSAMAMVLSVPAAVYVLGLPEHEVAKAVLIVWYVLLFAACFLSHRTCVFRHNVRIEVERRRRQRERESRLSMEYRHVFENWTWEDE